MRKFEREQQTDFDDELKRFQQEQSKQYKIKKDTLKKVNRVLIIRQILNCFYRINFIRKF